MNPEWQRRTVAIFLAVIFAAIIRKIEPRLARETGIDPVWITRVCAIAILIACFKLTDMIPDDEWRFRSIWRPRLIHAVMLVVSATVLALFYGAAH